MNWQRPWSEPVAVINDMFTTVDRLMDEFPDFRFSQSQASVCRAIADALVEAGFDCLQPLEVKAGVDLARLVQEYGRDVCFMGGVDVRALAAPEEVEMEREVKAKLDIGMAGPGGYAFHSDHSIPNQVSFARYGRIAQLVWEYGVYE